MLTEAGKYHVIDKDVFYVAKIKAEGQFGMAENGGCSTKRDIIPLTGYVCLRWSSKAGTGGWLASSKEAFDRTSFEHNKRETAARKKSAKRHLMSAGSRAEGKRLIEGCKRRFSSKARNYFAPGSNSRFPISRL